MEYLALGLALLIGLFTGLIISKARMNRSIMGWLRVDRSEPDEPTRLFLELKDVTPDTIAQKEFVMFRVINKSYISHD